MPLVNRIHLIRNHLMIHLPHLCKILDRQMFLLILFVMILKKPD